MPRTGENIYKRKDGRWEGRYKKERVDGKVRYGAVYARTYRDVKVKLEKAKKAFETGKTSGTKAGKVKDIGNQWLAEMALTLKESSINKYEDILRCYVLPELGEEELSEVTNQHVMDFTDRLLADGGRNAQGLSPATVAEILSVLNGIRIYALRRDRTVLFSTGCVRLRREPMKIRVFTLSEEESLIRHIEEHMDLPSLGVLLCLFTGIRVGELCALSWDDISLPEKKMYVSKTMQRMRTTASDTRRTAVRIQEPKSSCSVRTIPLPGSILELLKLYHTPGTFFLTGDSRRYIEPRTMQNRFKKLLAACNISDANFHATRHTFATRCIELGFDVKSLSEILGHADVTITMNRYVHPSMSLKEEHMERFSGLFAVK
ncbi:MAG TPA: site-specific integrase [Lachnospiraceae bacterium]|nr:site-specific integrase [Lachnospiraceae bacterium]